MDTYYQHERLQQQQQQQQPPPPPPQSNSGSNQAHHAGSLNSTTSAPRPAANSQPNGQSGLMDEQSLLGGDSLDNIVSDNHSTLHRRRSMPPPSFGNETSSNRHRRLSTTGNNDMITFGDSSGDLRSYQFNQSLAPNYPTINTSNLNMPSQVGNYMSDHVNYSALSPDMMGTMMPSTFAGLNMGAASNESPIMHMFPNAGPSSMSAGYPQGSMTPMGNDYSLDLQSDDGTLGGTQRNAGSGLNHMDGPETDMLRAAQYNHMDPNDPSGSMAMSNFNQTMPPPLSRHVSSSASALSPPHATSSGGLTHRGSSSDANTPATTTSLSIQGPKDATVYSKSGFDMLKALWLVATRKAPKIHLGAVDMSCAFVVCDVSMNDCPIIYVSDNFQNLTGYSRHEIVGRNCRFLQAPDGKVEAGSKREFVDDGAVFNLKKMIHEGREVQQSLINYRKGGKPFLNLLTMIPIPWDTDEIRYFIGFQIDLVECPDAIASGQEHGGVKVNYKHSDIGQYIWTPPSTAQWEPESGQTLAVDDVSTLLQQYTPNGLVSDWHKQSWDKMLLENTDDVVHVLSLKGLFLYLSPSCKRILEYDASELVGNSLSTVCHPSDIVPVTRELKDAQAGNSVNISFRIRRKNSGYTWFESHGSLFIEQGKGRKCIILVGRKRPVIALSRRSLEAHGGIGDSEFWTKLSTSGMFLFVSSNVRSLLDLQPESLIGTSIQELMRKESRPEFGRAVEKARRGKVVTCKHEVQNRRGQVLQAQTVLYPGDAQEGQKPSFLLAQTKLLKATSRSMGPVSGAASNRSGSIAARSDGGSRVSGPISQPAGGSLMLGTQDAALASDDNMFDELRTTKCSSWQFELRQMEKVNRILAEELGGLLSNKKKRKRRKGVGNVIRDCANCHTRNTPEWRRGPSGQRDLCNSCGLRWAKQTGRVSPRNSSRGGREGAGDASSKKSASPKHTSPLHRQMMAESPNPHVSNGDGAIDPAQLAQQGAVTSALPPAVQQSLTMPPPSQSSVSNGVPAVSMTSIREERESSQTG